MMSFTGEEDAALPLVRSCFQLRSEFSEVVLPTVRQGHNDPLDRLSDCLFEQQSVENVPLAKCHKIHQQCLKAQLKVHMKSEVTLKLKT